MICFLVSLAMALVLPIISVEIMVAVNDIEERPDQAAYARAIEKGEDALVASSISMRKITGFERITHRFEDWYSFRRYLGGVAHYFVVLLIATSIVSVVRPYEIRST
jgi:hypothetical protein